MEQIESTKKHKFGVLRIIGMIIVGILVVSSIVFFTGSYLLRKPVIELREAIPFRVEVDLSKAGVYSGEIEHSEHEDYANFGVIAYLEHESDLTFPEIFNEIEGEIETFNEHGEVITRFKLHTESPPYQLGTGDIKGYPPCWVLSPFTAEQKTIKITVTKPLERLSNTKQVFEGHYLLNGMEYLPAGIAFMSGLILLGIGLIITLIIIFVPIYKKRKLRRGK